MLDGRRRARRSALAALLTLAGAPGAAAAQDDERARVEEAARATYVHGMTDEIAARMFGPRAVPVLLELLRDPDFPRRDNVVAALAHLGGAESTAALVALLDEPPADPRAPVEDRALLLAPQALGLIASRGESRALEALLAMTAPGANGGPLGRAAAGAPRALALRDDLVDMALRGLAWSRAPQARGRLDAVAQGRAAPVRGGRGHAAAARGALELFGQLHGTATNAGPPGPGAPATDGTLDVAVSGEPPAPGTAGAALAETHFDVNHAVVDYVNHVNVVDPMTDGRLDACLGEASTRMGRADFAGDVACCAGFRREGPGQPWGGANDGRDVIDNGTELAAVLGDPVARFKVVRAINHCGAPGLNFIGCAKIGGAGVAVVRFGSAGSEGALWAHEYGHNAGLPHGTRGSDYIMHATISGASRGLTASECNSYHTPAPAAQADLVDAGSCSDHDGDEVQDVADNCPDLANHEQTDADADGTGDACEAGCLVGQGAACGNGTCEAAEGEDCLSCPADCAGRQDGWRRERYCCGAGGGENPRPCSDARCNNGTSRLCTDEPAGSSCCGDLTCEGLESPFTCEIDCGDAPFCGDDACEQGEDACSCTADCGLAPILETHCVNVADDDCDGLADCSDPDCGSAGGCSCLPSGAACRWDDDCCSGACRGLSRERTCR